MCVFQQALVSFVLCEIREKSKTKPPRPISCGRIRITSVYRVPSVVLSLLLHPALSAHRFKRHRTARIPPAPDRVLRSTGIQSTFGNGTRVSFHPVLLCRRSSSRSCSLARCVEVEEVWWVKIALPLCYRRRVCRIPGEREGPIAVSGRYGRFLCRLELVRV